MAEETVVTNIVANANFSGLISDLNRVTASLANLQAQVSATNKGLASQIAVVNRQFGDTLRSTGQFTTHFASAGSDVETFGKNLDKGRLKLRDYYRTWQDHHKTAGGLIRDLAQQQVRLQNAIMQPLGRNAEGMMQFAVHVPRGLDVIKNKTAIVNQELKIMNRVMQEGANQLINWGKNTQWAGRQLTVGLTVPLAAFGKAAADAFRSADQELVRLTKVYGDLAGTSAADLGKVREEVTQTAKELASGLGAAFNETLALGADIAATGKTGEELLGSIRETTRLAILGEVDRAEAMKATLAIQTAFNQNTEQLAESINFLNAVENQTSTTLNDLVEAIPRAGTIIKGLGGNVQDLALYLTAMREGGVSAAEGANALKSALGSLINPTDVAVDKFQSFGIDLLGIVNNNAGDVTKTLFALQAALDTLDPLQKQQAIEQLFGKFQFARLGALFDNLGRQGSQTLQVLDLMKASSDDLANVASRELTAVTESASGKYRRALEELKADLASVGEQFLTINTYLIKFVDKIIDFASNLPGPIKTILSLFGGLTAIAGPLIMLTGVLGNFFGYIVKGIYHFKSLFKSAEGWRLLTPEIMAANQAGSVAESTFYSDARAAQILNQALKDLTVQYDNIAMRAQAGAISVQPMMSTMAGNIIMTGGGGRVVNPNSPLVGQMGTRASAHMVPRGTQQPGTIFGLVPSSIPVNLAVGQNPQVYMEEAMPLIPGVTSVQTKKYGQVSTGIVASEAARHHAMTATLAMQSTQEVENLKKMMATTGTVTSEFMQTFDDLVPITSQITQNAATQSAAIVAELRAGKITVDAARQKIIALNIEIENMLGAAATEYAAATGRTINLTNVPTLNQPVMTATGKSNMRELFKSRTKGFFGNVARALGVRTYGAGYNIETTRPRKMNMGGYVYTMNDGNIVPGPNVNADVVPAMLTPGEFVVNRKAAMANLPLLHAINNGYNNGGSVRFQRGHAGAQLSPMGIKPSDLARGTRSISYIAQGVPLWMTSRMNQELRSGRPGLTGAQMYDEIMLGLQSGRHPFEPLFTVARQQGLVGEEARLNRIFNSMMSDLSGRSANRQFVGGGAGSFENYFNGKYVNQLGPEMQNIWRSYGTAYGARGSRSMVGLGTVHIDQKTGKMTAITKANRGMARGIPTGILGSYSGSGFGKGRATTSSMLSKAAMMILSRGRRMNRGGMAGMRVPAYQQGGQFLGMPGSSAATATWTGPMGGHMQPGAGRFAGSGGGLIAGMGMQMIGSQMGGTTGNAMMLGGLAMQIAPMLKPLLAVSAGIKTFSGLLKGVASIGKAAFMGIGNALRFLTGPIGLTITGLTIVGKLLYDWKRRAEEAGKANRLAFGGTEDSFASVGIKNYTTISDRIKDINEQLELHRAQVRSTYESYTKAGPTGLTLTIKELKDAIENAKQNQKDYVDAFSNIDSGRVVEYAAQLKAQFMAMGMSASEATNQIYAIVKASDNSSQAVAAISSSVFRSIQKQSDGIKLLITNLKNELQSDNFSAEEFATGLDTLLNSLMVYQDGLVGSKDAAGNIRDEADALAETLKEVGNIQGANLQISGTQLEQIKGQNIAYQSILGNVESIESIYAKIALYEQGFGRMLDLAKMTAEQAVSFAENLAVIQNQLNDITESTGAGNPLAPLASLINKTQEDAKNAASVVKNLQKIDKDYYDARIKAIQKSIDALEEERRKRLELLRLAKESTDFETTIEQAQNRLKNLIASGNMEAAAQEQLNIKKLSQERQYNLAVNAINEKYDKERKAKEDELEKAQNAKDKLAKGMQTAQTRAAQRTADLTSLKSYRDRIEEIATRYIGQQNPVISADDKMELSNIFEEMKNAGGETAKAAEKMRASFVGGTIDHSEIMRGGQPSGLATNIIDSFNKEVNERAKQNKDFAKAVTEFKNAVLEFKGKTDGTGKTLSLTETGVESILGIKNPESYTPFIQDTKTGKPTQELRSSVLESIINKKKLKKGDIIEVNGIQYQVTTGEDAIFGIPAAKKMGRALFGRVVPGREYLVGERGPELFRTDMPGNVMPKYNVPSSGYKFNSAGNNGTIGNISLTQTINAAPGMDERMLANLAAKQAAAMISAAQTNAMYRNGKNVRVGNA